MTWFVRLLSPLAPLIVFSGKVSAHQLSGSRFATPIPLEYLYGGAAITVFVTALISTRFVTNPETRTYTYTLLAGPATRLVVTVVQVFAVIAFAITLFQGLTGRQVPASNVATLLTWAVTFDGLAFVAAVFGSPWGAIAPWITIYDFLTTLESRDIVLLDWDAAKLAGWPALIGFLIIVGILENLSVVPESPADTAVLLSVYAIVMLCGLVAFGRDWVVQADPIGVFFSLVARVSPIYVSGAGGDGLKVTLRAPWAATSRPIAASGTVVFTVATVYTISFDGFTSTPPFRALVFFIHDVFGVAFGVAGIALYLVGFIAFLGAFAITAVGVERLGGGTDVHGATRRIAPTVLPIAVAYEFAHYGTYVATSASRLVEIALGGVGIPVFIAPLAWLSVGSYWGFEVVVIVVGHIVAIVAAHYATLARYDGHQRARRAHVPLVALMICYTVLSLWIISQPVVM